MLPRHSLGFLLSSAMLVAILVATFSFATADLSTPVFVPLPSTENSSEESSIPLVVALSSVPASQELSQPPPSPSGVPELKPEGPQDGSSKTNSTSLKNVANAGNHFGLTLFDKLAQQSSKDENIFLAPYSIYIALNMVYQGARGNTEKQLKSALGVDVSGLSKDLIGENVRALNQATFNGNSGTRGHTLNQANVMIASNSFTVSDFYSKKIKEQFNGTIYSMDFAKDGQANLDFINSWISNTTNGKLTSLLTQPPSPSTKLALINAVYFKGRWLYAFDENKTHEDTFTTLDGSSSQVKFMKIKKMFNITRLNELDASLIELPYEGEEVSLYAILPDETNSNLAAIRKALNPWYIESIMEKKYEQEVNVHLPKINFTVKYDLKETLKTLGVTDLFTGDSNLSDMSTTESNLAVDQIKHGASIEINEQGSEASGATFIGITRLAYVDVVTYKLNRPFLFFIRHNQNGQVLFIGQINKI